MRNLHEKQCTPCRAGTGKLSGMEIADCAEQVGSWSVVDGHHLEKEFRFRDFAGALQWVNAIGRLAEEEGHHPDIHLFWGRVRVEIWTHKVDGLTENDFILAAKIDRVAPLP